MKALDILFSIILLLLSSSQTSVYNATYQEPYSWVSETHTIAHAFGGIEEYAYTNSLEAFLENYQEGQRVFEVDLGFSSDGILVATHDWKMFYNMANIPSVNSEYPPLSLEKFRSASLYEKYTPLTWEEIALLMKAFPDIYIVTDTKYTTDPYITDAFNQIVEVGIDVSPSILDRIIPQIYNNEMYDIICEIYPWQSVIYTLYGQTVEEFSYDNVLNFVEENGILVVTTFPARSDWSFISKLYDLGVSVYMHTFNDTEQVEKWITSHHIQGVYTDSLTPSDVNPLYE